jgi:transposase
MVDCDTGEVTRSTLPHDADAVRDFYGRVAAPAVVGIEATGSMTWFLDLMEELGIECCVGHPAAVRKAETRRQKHDRRDADLLMRLLLEKRFPAIWMPSAELRDLRALLLHRHQCVTLRTRVQNGLQAIALSYGLRRKSGLWTDTGQAALAALPLSPHRAARRTTLQRLYRALDDDVRQLDRRVRTCVHSRPSAMRLMTHPGVGPITALATDVFLGDPRRFRDGKALASYVGMIPSEHSSGPRQRLGRLTKQGNPFLRFLWCEAAVQAAQVEPALRRFFRRKVAQTGVGKARVATARKLGIRLWIMLRDEIDYDEFCRRAVARCAETVSSCGNA